MTLPQAQAAVEDLRRAHRELLRVVDALSEADWQRTVPYGPWTVKDLVAHVIGDMSPSGPGLILAGVLTPQFIADTSKGFDIRARNQAMVDERRRFTREDLRQMLFEAHDAMIEATLRLDASHLPVLRYAVPMGPGYELCVEDWLWHGYHDRQHADDIRRALAVDYKHEPLSFAPEIDDKMRALVRTQEGLLRAVYSVAGDAWGEEAADAPGWTYHDVLAHVASNEVRLQVRLRSALGAATQAEIEAVSDIDGWNRATVEQRRRVSLPALVDELAAGRQATLQVLSGFQPQDVSRPVRLAAGETLPAIEFIDRVAAHTSRHAGHLVPASRARRATRRDMRQGT